MGSTSSVVFMAAYTLLADALVSVGEPHEDLRVVEEAAGDLRDARGLHDGVGPPVGRDADGQQPLGDGVGVF